MKNKKLFAILTLVCFLFTLMPVAAFAEGGSNTLSYAQFLQLMQDNNYNYDFKGATITVQTEQFCCDDNHAGNCPNNYTDYTSKKSEAPARIQGTNAQYQIFGTTTNVVIKNATFVADTSKGVALHLTNNSGWEGKITSGSAFNIEFQFLNSGDLTIEGCTFDGINVAPYHADSKTSANTTDSFVNNTFKNVYNAYGIQGAYAGTVVADGNTFENCAGGVYVNGGSSGISITDNEFSNMGNNCPTEKKDTKGLIQLSASVNLNTGAAVVITDNISDGSTPALRQLSSNVTEITATGNNFGGSSEFTTTGDTTGSTTSKSPVASVNGTYFATLDAAIKAANDDDTIDLLGNAIQLKDEYQKTGVSITKNITFTNGTFDISAVGTGEGANCYGVFGLNGKNVTFDEVNFIGSDYKSGMGVIYAIGGSTVTLKDCSFEISNDSHEWGGVLKGGNVANDKFIIENCKFNVTNVQRVITNAVVEITGSTIVAKTNDDKYVNHALRNVAGRISDSTITVDGFENGIKNDSNLNLELKDNSHVTLKNCDGKGTDKGYDLYLKDGATIDIDFTSTLIFDTKNIEDTAGILLNGKKVDSVYTLTFVWNIDGKANTTIMVEGNTKATKPEDSTKSGYIFKGWYTTADCTGSAYSFDTAVTENTTLYAKWNKKSTSSYSSGSSATVTIDAVDNATVKVSDKYAKKGDTVTITVEAKDGYYPESIVVKDKNGNEITVTRTGLNEYQFTMPSGKVDIDVDMQECNSQVVLQIGNTTIVNNGTIVNNDVAPFIQDGRTMVPIRVIVEQLGGVAAWDEATRTVTLTIDGKVLTMVIDEVIPGFDTAATIVDGRTYVPIRYISEAIGANVQWIAATNQIVIVK